MFNSDVAFPEKYVTENFDEIFRKISGNFLLNRKNVFIHNVSMKTAENTGKLLHSFKDSLSCQCCLQPKVDLILKILSQSVLSRPTVKDD